MKHFKQFTSFALAVVLAAGFTAAGAESEAGESSAASANTVKLGLMIAKNGQSLSSDEWEVLADIYRGRHGFCREEFRPAAFRRHFHESSECRIRLLAAQLWRR